MISVQICPSYLSLSVIAVPQIPILWTLGPGAYFLLMDSPGHARCMSGWGRQVGQRPGSARFAGWCKEDGTLFLPYSNVRLPRYKGTGTLPTLGTSRTTAGIGVFTNGSPKTFPCFSLKVCSWEHYLQMHFTINKRYTNVSLEWIIVTICTHLDWFLLPVCVSYGKQER